MISEELKKTNKCSHARAEPKEFPLAAEKITAKIYCYDVSEFEDFRLDDTMTDCSSRQPIFCYELCSDALPLFPISNIYDGRTDE